jgi:hypothetical protein
LSLATLGSTQPEVQHAELRAAALTFVNINGRALPSRSQCAKLQVHLRMKLLLMVIVVTAIIIVLALALPRMTWTAIRVENLRYYRTGTYYSFRQCERKVQTTGGWCGKGCVNFRRAGIANCRPLIEVPQKGSPE